MHMPDKGWERGRPLAHVNQKAFEFYKTWRFLTDEEAEQHIVEAALFENDWRNVIDLRDRLRFFYPLKAVELQLQSKKRNQRKE